jgi:hypothetical protein
MPACLLLAYMSSHSVSEGGKKMKDSDHSKLLPIATGRMRRQSPRSGLDRSAPEHCARAAEAPRSHSSWDAGGIIEDKVWRDVGGGAHGSRLLAGKEIGVSWFIPPSSRGWNAGTYCPVGMSITIGSFAPSDE